jgi:Tol biopolymer transport system component
MSLAAGTRLGPYEVAGLLGAGGMGEVYRARDPRLGRDVAIKVLPADYLTDADRLERFEREARATAALNHPNVVAIYDAGTSDGVPFIASELLVGATLREALTPGAPWPTRKALEVAQQIARGLAAAHARGIVHRDLKPENVFIGNDRVVKILDFGLARLKEAPVVPTPEEPTMPGTEAGRVLGTVGYMAPEQVRGQPADYRADIFAFGAILYEMLAGQRAFTGETAADTMTAILTKEPPGIVDATHPVPPALERIVTRCLDKRPEARFQSASDLAFALDAPSDMSSSGAGARAGSSMSGAVRPPTTRRQWLVGVAAVAVAAAVAATTGARFASAPAESTRATFLDIAHPSGPEIIGTSLPTLSDDGRHLVFVVTEKGGNRRLWLGSLDTLGFRPIPGTDGVNEYSAPFWSPDGRHLAFLVGTEQLKTVDLATGAVESLSAQPNAAIAEHRGTRNSSGDIIVSPRGLFHLRSSAGAPKPLVMPDLARGEMSVERPQFLPDGRHYLFTVTGKGTDLGKVSVGALGSADRTPILQSDSAAAYAAPGYLLFTRAGTLFAQRFDADRLTVLGGPERVAGGLRAGRSFGTSAVGVSQAGTLFFTTGDPAKSQFTWFDRSGRESGRVGDPVEAGAFDIAAADAAAVTTLMFPGDLWQIDTSRGGMRRLTDGADDADPRLSADGTSVLFAGTYGGRRGLDRVSLRGGARTRMYEPPGARDPQRDPLGRLILHDWSRDGRFALCDVSGRHREISAVTLPDGMPQVAIRTSGLADQARFSPDGRWIAYNDLESGRFEVFVVPFPATGERWQVSTSGGVQPEWRGDGRELFYLEPSGALMAVDVRSRPSLEVGPARPLFQTRLEGSNGLEEYRVTADGQRFLLRVPVGGTTRTTLVLNWPALLGK